MNTKFLPKHEVFAAWRSTAGLLEVTRQGLAVVRNNSIYTVSDIVTRKSRTYLAKSVRILSDPEHYSGTVLYEWLLHTTYELAPAEDMKRLADMLPAERAWLARPVPWVCSQATAMCTPGTLSLQNGSALVQPPDASDVLMRSGVTTLLFANFSRVNPAVQRLIQFESNGCKRIVDLAWTLRKRLESGACTPAPPHTAAVHLRLGDFEHLANAPIRPAGYRGWHPGAEVPLIQQAAALGCTNTTVVVNAVLNFDDGDSFEYNRQRQATGELVVAEHLKSLKRCGVPHLLRSSADVDSDQCFMVSSEYFVSSVGGFSGLMRDVRRVLRYTNGEVGANRTRQTPCHPLSRRAGWKWDPPRMPMKGCERKLAACAVSGRFSPLRWNRMLGRLWPLDQLNDYRVNVHVS